MNYDKHIGIVGAGAAGLEAATALTKMGFTVSLFEKNETEGGHLKEWDHLFPTLRPADEIFDFITSNAKDKTTIHNGVEITKLEHKNGGFQLVDTNGNLFQFDAVLLTTGFDLFDAHKKEEYGYGIYDNVITSADLESILKSGKIPQRSDGKTPEIIGFVHCVGSRDEKTGNIYCSRVCCVTAVKQAIEIKQLIPSAEVYCFYMDLRMYGSGFEELYKKAQEDFNVHFIRGRLSEASENKDGSIMLKVQDTLLARQMKISADLLVLMVGMIPSRSGRTLARTCGIPENVNGFLNSLDSFTHANMTTIPGVFVAGSCKAPSSITETLADARAAALAVYNYFSSIS
jgi:heterodisulfide reductase subunit A